MRAMLFYHGRGGRDYAANPLPIRRRAHWEWATISMVRHHLSERR